MSRIKIVCWGDIAIPVPREANWIAMDFNRTWWWFENEPTKDNTRRCWAGRVWPKMAGVLIYRECGRFIKPPEPGIWFTQLYKI